MGKKTNKSDESSKSSPGKSSLASDGVIIPSPKGSSTDEFPSLELTSEKLLQLVGNLSLKEKFSFLKQFDLVSKLEGRSPFSPEELEEIARDRLETDIIDESRFGKSDFFPPLGVSGDPPNDGQEDRSRDIVSPLDGIGFRPNADNFLPQEGDGTISPSLPASQIPSYQQHDHTAGNSSKHVKFGVSTTTAFRENLTTNSTHPMSQQLPTTLSPTLHPFTSPAGTQQQGPPNTFVHSGQPASSQAYYTHPNQSQQSPPNNPPFTLQPQQPSQHQSTHPHQFYPQQQQPNNHSHHHQAYQPTSQNQFNPNLQQQQYNTANHMPQGTQHGFMLRAVPRTAAQADYDNDRVIVSRKDRGNTVKERAKIRELCTTAITPQITRSNITKLLTTDSTNYDVAEDASQWQTTLRAIYRHVVASDFKHIVMIPLVFDENDPNTLLNPSTQFVNAVLDHDRLTDDHYKSFQRFLRRYGRDEEITSDNWFEEKLWKSLHPALLAEVSSDFLELDKDEDLSKPNAETCKGSLTLLRLIINRVVQSNQESRRALEEYIKTFDIRRFPGEDVTAASLRIKAVARSLGVDNLPSDIIHRVLEGFAHASTPVFQTFCATQESLITSSLIRDRLRNKHTLYKMLVDILTDLEVRYNDLRSGQRWLGHGHGASTADSVFVSSTTHDYHKEDGSNSDDDDDYAIYITSVGHAKALPFDVWVRDKKCHHCGEIGHIRPQCPNRSHVLSHRNQHRQRRDSTKHSGHYERGNAPTDQRSSTSHQRFSKPHATDTNKQYVKKVLTAALEMVDADDPTLNQQECDSPTCDTATESVVVSPEAGSKYSAFLAALGCSPKE